MMLLLFFFLTSVSVPLEVEPELEDVVVELAAEAPLVPVLPLSVHDLERDVLVRGTRRYLEYYNNCKLYF